MNKLAEALAKAQTQVKNASMNKINPHFKSRYADLAEIRDCTIPVFAEHGLAITQLTNIIDGQVVLITRLLHTSGESIDSVYPLNADPLKPQAMGSAMTYARRYCLAAMCGIAAEEDDDGNAAEKNKRKATSDWAYSPSQLSRKKEDLTTDWTANNVTVSAAAKPKAESRKPFEDMVAALRQHTSLDTLDDWWGLPATDIDRRKLPVDWQSRLFVEFICHGLSIAENEAAASQFKVGYSKPISMLTDDERQGIDDMVQDAKASAQ